MRTAMARDAVVNGDAAALEALFLNLLLNGVEAAAPRRTRHGERIGRRRLGRGTSSG